LESSEVNVRAFLGLGSNEGNREVFLEQTRLELGGSPDIITGRISSIYETAPWGRADQPKFLNQVIEIHTCFQPRQLLSVVKQLETRANRKRLSAWGPRTLDVDILLYGDLEVCEPDLQIPHRFLHLRRFVLEPLVEIDPNIWIPGWRMTSLELLKRCEDTNEVKII
jgi:2-amino-4-hydroxy-6-hydroxymethyldihydropteridine diphosphokinase